VYAISAQSVCSVTMKSDLFNQQVMNVFHYMLDLPGGTLADGGSFLDSFNARLVAAGFNDSYTDCLPAQCVTITQDLQWINPDRFVKKTYDVNPAGSFGNTTISNIAGILMLRGDIAGKSSIGVKHLPGLGGTNVVDGKISAAYKAQLTAFGTLALAPVTVGARTMTPIIFGLPFPAYVNKKGKAIPAKPLTKRFVTQFTVEDTSRVMRRRTVGLGI
jgi:hypothetical protein